MTAPVTPSGRRALLAAFIAGRHEQDIIRETTLPASVIRAERRRAQDSAAWPGPDEVAWVVVAACRQTEDMPEQISEPYRCSRGRGVAFIALHRVRPLLHPVRLAKMLGAQTPTSFASNWTSGGTNLTLKWFDPAMVDAVVAEVYGEPGFRFGDLPAEQEGCDSSGAETAQKPALAHENAQENRSDSGGAEPDASLTELFGELAAAVVVPEPAPIEPLSNDEAKPEVEPVAEAPAQPEPKSEPICQPEAPAPVLDIPRSPPKVSAAAHALATFQRARIERKPAAKPAPEPRRASFTNAAAIDLHYRPDRTALKR